MGFLEPLSSEDNVLLESKDFIVFNFIFLTQNPTYVARRCFTNVCGIDELPQGELGFTTLHVHAAACDHL